jgi:hypothetical protein
MQEGGRREERALFFIKIMGWEATVLPNVLGNTIASQPENANLGYLLWVNFWCLLLCFP